VIEVFSRRLVDGAGMTAQLIADTLLMAVWRRGRPNDLLQHSDQGSQYTSEQFQRLMADNGIVCSMNRSGNFGQRGDGELLLVAQDERTAQNLSHRERGQSRCVRISNGSTTRPGAIRRSGISALLSSSARWD
jgi:putative transposase